MQAQNLIPSTPTQRRGHRPFFQNAWHLRGEESGGKKIDREASATTKAQSRSDKGRRRCDNVEGLALSVQVRPSSREANADYECDADISSTHGWHETIRLMLQSRPRKCCRNRCPSRAAAPAAVAKWCQRTNSDVARSDSKRARYVIAQDNPVQTAPPVCKHTYVTFDS